MAFRIGPPIGPHPTFKKPQKAVLAERAEIFDELLPASWKPSKSGVPIHFPVESIRVLVQQDLAQHKYWNVDGARVESTGRGPIEFEAVIPFLNGIFPGPNEKWTANALYPQAFRAFLSAFVAEKSGIFTHPELGEVFCRCASLDFEHTATTRDGVKVTAKWIESREEEADRGLAFSKPTPLTAISLSSASLDAQKTDLLALVPEAEFADQDFTSLVNNVIGRIDSQVLALNQLVSTPARIEYAVSRLLSSMKRAAAGPSARSWKAREAAERLGEAAGDLKKADTRNNYAGGKITTVAAAIPQGKRILRHTNKLEYQSLTQIHSYLVGCKGAKVTVEELRDLNPSMVTRPYVGPGTVIRYYG